MDWEDNFKEGKELVMATCSKNAQPNANVVISLGLENEKLLVADCSMITTISNLKENPKICIVGGYFKICGSVEIVNSGEYFVKGVEIVSSQDETLKVKNIIIVSVDSIFDLEKVKKIR